MTRPNPILKAAALAHAERGWHVFPLAPGGKKPVVAKWQDRATTDPERIARCWDHGPYNIGIACGPSGLLVVDLDKPKTDTDTPPTEWAEQGATDGFDVFYLLATGAQQPYPGDTYTVATPTGGQHLYFRAPDGTELRNTAGKLGWKIDTRAHGGYVVAAASMIDGTSYAATVATGPDPLPSWLTVALTTSRVAEQPVHTVAFAQRWAALGNARGYCDAALRGELSKVLHAREGTRNRTLYGAAFALARFVASGDLPTTFTAQALIAAGTARGLPVAECEQAIRSGFARGATTGTTA